MIDPAIFSSEQFCELTRDARLLFIGCFAKADDCGFITASGHALRLEIFPTDGFSKQHVEGLRSELERVGLVERYACDDGEYLWIPHFLDHQRLRYRSNTKTLRRL